MRTAGKLFCVFVTLVLSPISVAQESTAAAGNAAIEEFTFAAPAATEVRGQLLSWLASTGKDATTLKSVTANWSDDALLSEFTGEELLDLLVQSFAMADTGTNELVESSFTAGPLVTLLYDGIRDVPFYRDQVQLFQARWFAQHRYYDEALQILTELNPETVVDPAGLLFYRAICEAELLQRQNAMDSLTLLLNNTLDVPQRFEVVARMMLEDLASRKDGMQKVERLMKDVERRLDLGRPDKDTQEQGLAVIEALDKLLEDLDPDKDEDQDQNQQQQQQQGQQQQSQQQRSTQAGNQSQIKGGSADGTADRKELKQEGTWGMLDKKKEAKARELIRRRLPANYLDQIGRFSRKLAEQKK